MDIEHLISRLKAKHGATTDQELARALHLGRSTVGSWRARGVVPERYVRSLGSDATVVTFAFAFDEMTEQENLALCLALMRLIRDCGPIITDERIFLSKGDALVNFLVRIYHQALLDMDMIAAGAERTFEVEASLRNHFNVLVHDEFFAAK